MNPNKMGETGTVNTALILSGGVGSRMGTASPKQYLELKGHPIIDYSLQVFFRHMQIDAVVIVAAEKWRGVIDSLIPPSEIKKFKGYAEPGENRQLSIFNGLKKIKISAPDTEQVMIHDAVRPIVSSELVSGCLAGLNDADGVMPVLPMKDTCYKSEDGMFVDGFLPRSQLFAGQAPEAYRFLPYLSIHYQMSEEEMLQISGSSEMAYKNGLKVRLIEGSERNIKITTRDDLILAEQYLDSEG